MQASTIEANGITLHYESFGREDAEVFLLIAGLGTQMIRWPGSFCQALAAKGYRVIRFDNRDSGLSTHFNASPAPDFRAIAAALGQGRQPEVPYTLHDMVADTIGLLDALFIPRAHLIGRSMGGMIAQLIAADHPHRVFSLVSIMASTGNPDLPPAEPDVMAMLLQRASSPTEDEDGFLTHRLAFARRISSPGYPFNDEEKRESIREETRRAYNPSGFARQLAAIAATGDNRARLAKITAPTLVIHGAADPLIPPAAGEDTAAAIPGAELMIVPGMGHDLPTALHEMIMDAIVANARRTA
ncbi:MAG: Pimeloyl-ACP methyl ester carboxylesterase [Akkermansiaceae bacterium]|nr:Pimeloyl-ACP methyl ester carboxylesterase [Akkermansiaceae bacterium]